MHNHNIKNGRTGHLFQNRFKSEVVNSDAYFLTVLRYIHQNPLKAGMVSSIQEYKWCSYNNYFSSNNILVNTSFALSLFKDIKQFEDFMNTNNDDRCLEHSLAKRYTDEELKEIVSSFVTLKDLHLLDMSRRNTILKKIKETTRASNRQLSRVLDVGRGIMDRIK